MAAYGAPLWHMMPAPICAKEQQHGEAFLPALQQIPVVPVADGYKLWEQAVREAVSTDQTKHGELHVRTVFEQGAPGAQVDSAAVGVPLTIPPEKRKRVRRSRRTARRQARAAARARQEDRGRAAVRAPPPRRGFSAPDGHHNEAAWLKARAFSQPPPNVRDPESCPEHGDEYILECAPEYAPSSEPSPKSEVPSLMTALTVTYSSSDFGDADSRTEGVMQ